MGIAQWEKVNPPRIVGQSEILKRNFSLSLFFFREESASNVVEHRKTLTTVLTWKTEKSDYALD